MAALVVPMGMLLPDSILKNEFIAVLAAFVAINTVVYVTLAVAKMLPKFYLRDWLASATGARRPAASTPTPRSADRGRPARHAPRPAPRRTRK